jgi:hypothetical protein
MFALEQTGFTIQQRAVRIGYAGTAEVVLR